MKKALKENILTKDNRIIVVDNEPIVVEGLKSLLNATPSCNVVGVAENGNDVKYLLENIKANIIFLEMKLPGTNIYRLIKDLIVLHPAVKIIAFSNFTMTNLVQDVMEFGVNAFLSKNANLEEILSTIDRVKNGERFISPSVYRTIRNAKMGMEDFPNQTDEGFAKLAKLSEREMDVLILQNRGMDNKQIAKALQLSRTTILSLHKNILRKIQLGTKTKLFKFSKAQGLV